MNPVMVYDSVDSAYPYIIRGTNQQTNDALLWQPPQYRTYSKGGAVSSSQVRSGGVDLAYFGCHQRTGGVAVVGIGVRIPNYLWKAGQWDDANTTFIDDTTAAQDTTTNDFALETTTNNDGFVILSRVKFNAVSINVTVASVDAGTVARAVSFSNAAGSDWGSAPANLFVQTGAAAHYATGEAAIAFAPPIDWGRSSSLGTDLPNGYYAMRVRATDAPATTAGNAKALEIYRMYYLTEAVADNGTLTADFGAKGFRLGCPDKGDIVEGCYGDALVALFSTANDQNRVTALVRGL